MRATGSSYDTARYSAGPTHVDMQFPPGSMAGASPRRPASSVFAGASGRGSTSHSSQAGSPGSPARTATIQPGLPVLRLALLAALLAVFAVMLAAGPVWGQQAGCTPNENTICYPENGKDAVATFTATDPEDETPITWTVHPADTPADLNNDGDTDDSGEANPSAHALHFDIDKKTGALTFDVGGDNETPDRSVAPDFENPKGAALADTPSPEEQNTYKVLVVATDDSPTRGPMGYHQVTVKVTNVDEAGKVSWTVDPDGGETHTPGTPKLVQFQVGASLKASVTDGDIRGNTKTVAAAHPDVAADPTWRWYRSSSKTAMGTMIEGATSATYIVKTDDVGMHLRAVAYYQIKGNVDQETASLTSDYPVIAKRPSDRKNALKFNPDEVTMKVAENSGKGTVVGTVTATGAHGKVNYTLVDPNTADENRFKIDQQTGQITILLDKGFDFEAGAGNARNCTDEDRCEVTVRATDASGAATATPADSDNNVYVDMTVIIAITDVNEKPVFGSNDEANPTSAVSPKMIKSPENRKALFDDDGPVTSDFGVTYAATDPEEKNLTYHLMGPDGAKFELSEAPNRVLSFREAPDREKPTDRNRDNVYEVTVRASDSVLHEDRMVKVTVTDVDEAPLIMGKESFNFRENGKDAVATFTATDPEDETPITWTVHPADTPADLNNDGDTDDSGEANPSAHALHFDIDKKTGALTFDVGGDNETPDRSVAPDFENPKGAALADTPSPEEQNTYKVLVVATDDSPTRGPMGYHQVTVKVTNVDEAGKVSWTTDADADGTEDDPKLMQFAVGAQLVASVTDGDIRGDTKTVAAARADVAADPTWQWYRGGSPIGETEEGDSSTYIVKTDDVNKKIRVTATYRIGDSTARETASLTSDYPVIAERPSDRKNALKFNPDEVTMEVAENSGKGTVVGTVTATGAHGKVNYTLVDPNTADENRFKIDQQTGQITILLDKGFDFEAGAGSARNCTDEDRCEVTVRATDASGAATATPADSDNNVYVDMTVIIAITDVNEKPVFGSNDEANPTSAVSPKMIKSPENRKALFDDDGPVTSDFGVTYAATDPEDLNVNLTLMGPDGAKFELDEEGVLSFREAPDYEKPTDRNRDNVYEVTVRASDGVLHEDRMVKVTVTDVDEAPLIMASGIAISGPGSRSYAENGTDAVGTYEARGEAAAAARWTLEGDDAADFTLSSASGASTELRFRSSPNYEAAADADRDNTYMVTLKATANGEMDTHEVTVKVTNVDELGAVRLAPATPTVGNPIAAAVADRDGEISNLTWVWETSSDKVTWTEVTGRVQDVGVERTSVYTPVAADEGKYLRATANYTDGHGTGKSEMFVSTNMVTTGDPLVARYDANNDGEIQKREVITAINEYLDGGTNAPTKADVIRLINLYLDA